MQEEAMVAAAAMTVVMTVEVVMTAEAVVTVEVVMVVAGAGEGRGDGRGVASGGGAGDTTPLRREEGGLACGRRVVERRPPTHLEEAVTQRQNHAS